MVRSKRAVGCILACLAIAGIASSASAAVFAGQVGGGIHMQFGPQNAAGDFLGIASESYDFYSDAITGSGFGGTFPGWGTAMPDGIVSSGYVLLAFDPYTGEVWNNIPTQHQALDGAGYFGHAPTISLSDVDAGSNPIASAVVQADLARGYTTDNTVYITGGHIAAPHGGIDAEPFGAFINTSSDGGILSTAGWPIYAGGAAMLLAGDEVRPYAPYEAGRPNNYEDESASPLNFDQIKTWGATGFWSSWYGYWPGGYNGQIAGTYYGFEMDGIQGWMKLDFAGDRTGVRLTEYYFDVPEPATMSLLALGGLAILRRKRS